MLCQNWWEQAVCDRSTETWRSWLLLWGSQLQGVQGETSCSFFSKQCNGEKKMRKNQNDVRCGCNCTLINAKLSSHRSQLSRGLSRRLSTLSVVVFLFCLAPNFIWPIWPNSYFENKKKIKGATWSRALQWGVQRPSEQICRLPQRGETFLWFKNRFYSSLS